MKDVTEESLFEEREGWGESGWIIVKNLLGEFSSLWEESWTLCLFPCL